MQCLTQTVQFVFCAPFLAVFFALLRRMRELSGQLQHLVWGRRQELFTTTYVRQLKFKLEPEDVE